jgi:hypothetical protein
MVPSSLIILRCWLCTAQLILLLSSLALGFTMIRHRCYHCGSSVAKPDDWYGRAVTQSSFPSSTSARGVAAPATPRVRQLRSSVDDHQSTEALQSLRDFHVGQWRGSAVSFAVTNDVAAGIVRRNVSKNYTSTVERVIDPSPPQQQEQRNGYCYFRETIAYDNEMKSGTINIRDCQMDVDAVDASYSLDHHYDHHDHDQNNSAENDDDDDDDDDTNTNSRNGCGCTVSLLPAPETLEGIDSNEIGWCVEHCLVTSDTARVRSFVVYDTTQQLVRVVVCHEERIRNSSGGVGGVHLPHRRREPLLLPQQQQPQEQSQSPEQQRLVDASMISSTTDPDKVLELMTANLLELASGVWLGDAVVRDNGSVSMSPIMEQQPQQPKKKGFGGVGFGIGGGATSNNKRPSSSSIIPFASWSVGVQKIAWRWLWDFGEDIRQVVDLGKVLGCPMLATEQFNVAGTVIANESMSRRITKAQRMVFIDWGDKDSVGFLVGSVAVQVCTVRVFFRPWQVWYCIRLFDHPSISFHNFLRSPGSPPVQV